MWRGFAIVAESYVIYDDQGGEEGTESVYPVQLPSSSCSSTEYAPRYHPPGGDAGELALNNTSALVKGGAIGLIVPQNYPGPDTNACIETLNVPVRREYARYVHHRKLLPH